MLDLFKYIRYSNNAYFFSVMDSSDHYLVDSELLRKGDDQNGFI